MQLFLNGIFFDNRLIHFHLDLFILFKYELKILNIKSSNNAKIVIKLTKNKNVNKIIFVILINNRVEETTEIIKLHVLKINEIV